MLEFKPFPHIYCNIIMHHCGQRNVTFSPELQIIYIKYVIDEIEKIKYTFQFY